jgi:hypothetical protein
LNLIISSSYNYLALSRLKINRQRLIIIGEKNKKFFNITKNVKFMSLDIFLKTYKNKNIKSILLLDDLDYLNEDSINIFMKGKCKTLSGCNFYGNEEIYLSQVMGVLPDVLFEDWHDNYIDKNHLGTSDLPEDLIENYMYSKSINFNKFRSSTFKSVYFTTNNIFSKIRNKKIKTIKDLIITLIDNKTYIKSGCWYIEKDKLSERIISRLYKH